PLSKRREASSDDLRELQHNRKNRALGIWKALSEQIGLRRAGWSPSVVGWQNPTLFATSKPALRSSAWR
ncbi:MAG: hypothetical protein ABJQ14_13190, partial [Hyphomicrobiales bacterium]